MNIRKFWGGPVQHEMHGLELLTRDELGLQEAPDCRKHHRPPDERTFPAEVN